MFSGTATKLSQALPRATTRAGIGNPQRGIHTNIRPKFFQVPSVVTRIIARILPSQIQASSSSIQSGIALGARTLHQSSVRSSIRQGLSFPARISLSSPLHAPRLPRVPALPRTVAHVGLGTARNFSSARPLFQNLVDNVPVVGRALWEADWDTRCMEEVKARKFRTKQTSKKPNQGRTQEKLKPVPTIGLSSVNTEEMGRYFSEAAPTVITYLQIPLAPTPTARVPLSMTPQGPELIPLPMLAKSHALHADHSGRVSQLFARLDNARVWERGASVEALGDRTGLCTVLRVKFEGWSERMVEEVIGVDDVEWCTVQETRLTPFSYDDIEDSSSLSLGSILRSPPLSPSLGPLLTDSQSVEFVMPTLDFSSSFLSVADNPPAAESLPRPASPLFSDVGSDESFSDIHFSSSSDSDIEDASGFQLPQSSLGASWFAFSSDFRNHAGVADDFYF